MAHRVGGFGADKPADADVKALFETEEVRKSIAEALGHAVNTFTVETYSTQVVAGLNYSVHGTVNENVKVHVLAFKALPHAGGALQVNGVEVRHG